MEAAPVTDVLDQSEVDALLAAVDAGQVQSHGAPASRVFGTKGPSQVDVQVYDFKRPERRQQGSDAGAGGAA